MVHRSQQLLASQGGGRGSNSGCKAFDGCLQKFACQSFARADAEEHARTRHPAARSHAQS